MANIERELARAQSKHGDTVSVTPTRVMAISDKGRIDETQLAAIAAVGASNRGVFSQTYRLELFLKQGGSWDLDFASPRERFVIEGAIRRAMRH